VKVRINHGGSHMGVGGVPGLEAELGSPLTAEQHRVL
jgi:hypothetical protein